MSPQFVLQMDESTDVTTCAQLLVYVRYIHQNDFKDEFLFCQPLTTQTRGIDIFDTLMDFFATEQIDSQRLSSICTDGAPAMLGCRSGFVARVKEVAPHVFNTHCMIHREALASKTLPASLNYVLKDVIQMVNFVKASALNTRLFHNLCSTMDSDHQELLFHTEVRWLSKGNVLNRFLEMNVEIREFLVQRSKFQWAAHIADESWCFWLCYLCDIFQKLNFLNLSLQGKQANIMEFVDKLTAFQQMIELWLRKLKRGNISMFTLAGKHLEEHQMKLSSFSGLVSEHLDSLQKQFCDYFPETKTNLHPLVRNPFTANVDECFTDDMNVEQEQLVQLVCDTGARHIYDNVDLSQFWISMLKSYPTVAAKAIKILMPFPSTYLCELAFSKMLNIKTIKRNRIDVQPDLRCCISTTLPRIPKLVNEIQYQPSH